MIFIAKYFQKQQNISIIEKYYKIYHFLINLK